MSIRHHQTKIYYSAGLISLMLLPALCFVYIHFNKREKQSALEVAYFDPEGYKVNAALHVHYPKLSHPKRDYLDIELDGNDKNDSVRLAFSQLSIRSLTAWDDTIKGAHFHLNKGAKVWSLIGIFDICNIEKAKSYSAYDNDFWVFNVAKHERQKKIIPVHFFEL